ncbi:hypothetical protein J3458_002185 [Metarhizium acridum]|nr:hypothetical protein J3458_002185 [Metarhizium acridum]
MPPTYARTTSLFEQDPLLVAVRAQPFWMASGLSTLFWGYWSIKAKSIRVPLSAAFLIFTGGIVGFATIQPDDSLGTWFFAGVSGIGFGGPLILIITGIQLATPHVLIATATALAVTTRAVSVAVFTVILSIAFTERLQPNIVSQVSTTALKAGLPAPSVVVFVAALAAKDMAALRYIQGVTPQIIAAGIQALR